MTADLKWPERVGPPPKPCPNCGHKILTETRGVILGTFRAYPNANYTCPACETEYITDVLGNLHILPTKEEPSNADLYPPPLPNPED